MQKNHQKREIIFDKNAKKVLNQSQQLLKPLLEDFSITHFLWGWTAIALYLGHRESIDFDFFSRKNQWSFADFVNRIWKYHFEVSDDDKRYFRWIEFQEQDEIHVNIDGVRLSCIHYFRTLYNDQQINIKWEDYVLWWLRIASLDELLAMKLFAMISRRKWKDAIDVYFILKFQNISLKEALEIAENQYFINIFNKSAVLEQILSMDWDKTEKVNYLIDLSPNDEAVMQFLKDEALKCVK